MTSRMDGIKRFESIHGVEVRGCAREVVKAIAR